MINTLLVDDEYWVCTLLSELIEWTKYGYKIVHLARNGQEAYEYIKEHKPDLVFTDIRMPGMTGIDLLEKCAAEGLPSKFVMVSGYNDFEYAKAALRYGALDYLLKPVEPDLLISCLSRISRSLQVVPDDTAQLKKELDRNRLRLKEEFFLGFRSSEYRELDGYTPERLNEKCGGSFAKGAFHAVKYTVDTSLGEDYFSPILDSLSAELYEKMGALCFDMVNLRSTHSVTALLNYEGAASATVKKCAKDLFSKYKNIAQSKADCTMTLGIGRPVEKQISGALTSVSEAIHYRIKLGTGRVIDLSEETFDELAVDECFDAENKQCISGYILSKTDSTAKEIVRQISDKCFFSSHVNPASTMRVLRGMLHYIYAVPTVSARQSDPPVTFDSAWRTLETFSNREQIEDYLALLLEQFRTVYYEDNSPGSAAAVIYDYIGEHYSEDLSLSSLGELVHLNGKYISDLFRNTYGYTITAYVTQCRMNAAKALLLNSDFSVVEIGARVGMNDPKHFSKTFRKEIGLSPLQYRKLYS